MKSIKEQTIAKLRNCAACDDAIEVCFVLTLKNKAPSGLYCSRGCADADKYGPIFKAAKIRKLGVLKVEIT